jgi:elongation factor P
MLSATQIRKGMVLNWDNKLWYVMNANHHTPGNKRAIIQIKMRNLKDGSSREQRFSSGDKIEQAYIESNVMEYLYKDGDDHVFINQDTFDQINIHKDVIGDDLKWMKENVTCKVSLYEGRVLGVELPAAVTLQVVDTEPPLKGATITNVSKPAITDTGGVVQVPSFIEKGEHIEVDTRDGKYLGRGKAEE